MFQRSVCLSLLNGLVIRLLYCSIVKFQQQPDLWKEIEKVTTALRSENDTNDTEKQFLCEMFKHISLGKFYWFLTDANRI